MKMTECAAYGTHHDPSEQPRPVAAEYESIDETQQTDDDTMMSHTE